MLSHDLAKKLLEEPNLPVLFGHSVRPHEFVEQVRVEYYCTATPKAVSIHLMSS